METVDLPKAEHDLLSVMPGAASTIAIAVAEQVPVQADSVAAVASSQAHHAFLQEITPLSSATANAVAEPVQARAETAAAHPSATIVVFQVPEKAALYNEVRDAVLPAVDVIAERKNVPLAPEERYAVIDHALAALSRRTLQGIMSGETTAIEHVQLALDHSIDRLAANRFAWTIMRISGDLDPDPVAMITMADETFARHFANDQAPSMRVWPDLVAGLADTIMQIAEQEAASRLLSLPESAESRVSVRATRRSRRKGDS